ncbi:hypothetical protein BGX38DRAFT_1273515 [Terfezia claveryi]|nr:hypothetical protein BGX38DRAFT_1273515 [Terfezia claveryi]
MLTKHHTFFLVIFHPNLTHPPPSPKYNPLSPLTSPLGRSSLVYSAPPPQLTPPPPSSSFTSLLFPMLYTPTTPLSIQLLNLLLLGVAYEGTLTTMLHLTVMQAVISSASYAFRSTGSVIGVTGAGAVFQNIPRKELERTLAGGRGRRRGSGLISGPILFWESGVYHNVAVGVGDETSLSLQAYVHCGTGKGNLQSRTIQLTLLVEGAADMSESGGAEFTVDLVKTFFSNLDLVWFRQGKGIEGRAG